MSEPGRRPGSITFVVVMVWIGAFYNLALGVWLMLAPIGKNPSVTDALGRTQELPGFWLFVNGAMTFVLGLIYVWLARMAGVGATQAQVLIQVLSVINIVFALLHLPYGWLALLLNALILVFASNDTAKRWFTNYTA